MTLRAIFEKPVDRPIEGVIKADDEACLKLEIEEYVLTNEVAKRLEDFLDAYKNYKGANGAWISGFFGSGKSHLLKMLALVLEDRVIDGKSALSLFLPKCGDNEILRADLKAAAQIPSKSILFNIDQKADVISKKQLDALLAVFVKVFDEMCGYYGKLGHIAQFERDLDGRGLLKPFREAYERTAGRPWEQGREQALLEGKNIAKAYAEISGDDEGHAVGILGKYRDQYRLSIEDFADQVNAYVEKQPDGFRLNFFVDEVGQYIADNVKLMTNLQTIAESLATKSRGRAWVIVTAQEDMNSVVGEMTQKQGNDFTKIQARFKTRMKLTSTNVEEVIQKRLLQKTDEGIQHLASVYSLESNNFKTLFDFSDGAQLYRNFRDRDHFIHCYPFIPYQFVLFQSAIQNLSIHNAFEGKHSSVGERSMLGVFQQVAIQIGDRDIGQLATFDLMFEGIRTALKASTQRAVQLAEQHLESRFAVRVLKALFLVKYVKEFKATPRNLCVLMLEGFGQNVQELRRRVEEALNLLEQQTYIQRNGDLYEFLTDEEKDIEQEIKNTDIDTADVAAELESLVFDQVLKARKIRYDDNGQEYPFTRKLDDKIYGKEHELTIHVASPFHEHIDDEFTLLAQGMGRDELLVRMAPDARFVVDLGMYKRTDKYIRHATSTAQQGVVRSILEAKARQNHERLLSLQQRAESLLGSARMYTHGSELDIGGEIAQKRIAAGFQILVSKVYPNLRMLRKQSFRETDVGKCLKNSHDGLVVTDVASLSEPEQELFAFVQTNARSGLRTTMKGVLDRFQRKPYGWYYAATLCVTASLCARGKVEVRCDGDLLEDDELEKKLCNANAHGNIVLDPQVEYTASQVRSLKEFFGDFFDGPPQATEAKAMTKEAATALDALCCDLEILWEQASRYPFVQSLKPVIAELSELRGKSPSWFLTELPKHEDRLLDMKEKIIEPLRRFVKGPQRAIFDDALQFLGTHRDNFAYLNGDDAQRLHALVESADVLKGDGLQQIKSLLDSMRTAVASEMAAEQDRAMVAMAGFREKLEAMTEFAQLLDGHKTEIDRAFELAQQGLRQTTQIAVVRDTVRRFEEQEYPRLLQQVVAWSQPKPQQVNPPSLTTSPGNRGSTVTPVASPPLPQVECVPLRSVRVSYRKPWISDEADIEEYLQALREALLGEVESGARRVQV